MLCLYEYIECFKQRLICTDYKFLRTSFKNNDYFNVHFYCELYLTCYWQNMTCKSYFYRGFRSLQGNMKQQERKKSIIYSIYAWGSASIFTIICIIMDVVPSVSKDLIRPELGVSKCWLSSKLDITGIRHYYGTFHFKAICD